MNELQRLASLIRQLQGALGGLEIRAGHVDSAGTVDLGEGVACTKVGTGDYRLTFDPPFRSTARVVAMPGQGTGTLVIFKQHGSEGATTSTFRLASVSTAGALTDSDFWFDAKG